MIQCTINGVSRDVQFGVSVTWRLGGRGTADVSVFAPAAAPQVGQPFSLYEDGVRIWAGTIDDVERRLGVGPGGAAEYRLTVVSREHRLSYRLIKPANASPSPSSAGDPSSTYMALTGTVNVSGTAVTWVSGDKFDLNLEKTRIVIGGNGYTVQSVTDSEHLVLAASAPGGSGQAYSWTPFAGNIFRSLAHIWLEGENLIFGTIEDGDDVGKQVYDYVSVADAFQQLAEASDFLWYVTAEEELAFHSRSTAPAGSSITASSILFGDAPSLTQTREDLCNARYQRISYNAFDPDAVALAGTGAAKSFWIGAPIGVMIAGAIEESGVTRVAEFGIRGVDSGKDFYYAIGENKISQDPTVAVGVSDATNASPIVITTTTPHTLATGHRVYTSGIAGNTAANGYFRINVTDVDKFELIDSAGNGTFTGSGGTVQANQPLASGDWLRFNYRRLGADVIGDEDAAAISARAAVESSSGRYERIDQTTDSLDAVGALSLAQAVVAASKDTRSQLRIATDKKGYQPGQLVSVTASDFGLSAAEFLIQEISAHDSGDGTLRYSLSLVNGQVLGGWRKVFEALRSTRKGSSLAVISGGSVTGAGSGGSGGTPTPAGPDNVTLGTPQLRYTLPDAAGKVYAEITCPYYLPASNVPDRLLVNLQAPDDAGVKAQIDNVYGWEIPATINVSADASGNTLNHASHPFINGDKFRLSNSGGALPGGLNDSTTYFVVNKATNSFQVALTSGGSAIDITTAGTGTHYAYYYDVPAVLPINEPEVSQVVMVRDTERVIKVTLEAPNKLEPWRLYAASGSDQIQNKVVRADQAGATPSVLILVGPPPAGESGEEYAPNVTGFALATGVGDNPAYSNPFGGDQTWQSSFTYALPTSDPRYSKLRSLDLVIESPDGKRSTDSRRERQELLISTQGVYAVPSAIATYKAWLVSVDQDGNRNTIVAGVTPMVEFTVEPQVGTAGQEYADVVLSFTVGTPLYAANADGQQVLKVPASCALPLDPRFGGWKLMMIRGGVHSPLVTLVTGASANGEITDFPTADEPGVVIYALSVSTNNFANTYSATVTPQRTVTLPAPPLGPAGQEYAPLATGFARKNDGVVYVNGVKYTYQSGGDPLYGMGATWNSPNLALTPRLGGYDAVIQYSDGRRELTSSYSANDAPAWDSDLWPLLSSGATFIIWLVSWDVNGRRNTIVTGVTPSVTITVTKPSGTSGQEYAPLVTGVDAAIVYGQDVDGGELWGFTGSWTAPTDPRFGKMRAIARNQANNDLVPLGDWGPQDSTFRTDLWPLRGSVTWDIRFHSVDTNGNVNPYVAGVTPVKINLTVSAQTTGKMKGGRVDPATLASSLAVTSGVLGVPVDGITETLVNNFAISENKLQNAQIIGAARIKIAAIQDAHFDRASASKIAIVNADIVSLAANKLLAGTVSVTLTLTAPDITVTSGTFTVKINGTDLIKVTDSAAIARCRISGANFIVESTSTPSTDFAVLNVNQVFTKKASGTGAILDALGYLLLQKAGGATYLQFDQSFGTSSVASAGLAGTLPSAPAGYLTVNINGSTQRIPYYNT